jgi:hypothetical protein
MFNPTLIKKRYRILEVVFLTVFLQVIQMCFDRVWPLFDYVLHNSALVIRFRLAILDGDGILRAMTEAGAKTVAEEIADKPRLSVDYLDRALRAIRDAQSATRALVLIYVDDFPFHVYLQLTLPGATTKGTEGTRWVCLFDLLRFLCFLRFLFFCWPIGPAVIGVFTPREACEIQSRVPAMPAALRAVPLRVILEELDS